MNITNKEVGHFPPNILFHNLIPENAYQPSAAFSILKRFLTNKLKKEELFPCVAELQKEFLLFFDKKQNKVLSIL